MRLESIKRIAVLGAGTMGPGIAQRPPTACSYVLPAERAEAATTVSLNQG